MQNNRTASPERRGAEIREGFLEEVILTQAEELSWKCRETSGVGGEVVSLDLDCGSGG